MIIELEQAVDTIIPFTNGWLANFIIPGEKRFCSIDLQKRICYYPYRGVSRGMFQETGSIIVEDAFKKRAYIDCNGRIIDHCVHCVTNTNLDYKFQFVEKDCLFNKMFEIPDNKIAVIANKKNGNCIIFHIENIFHGFKSYNGTKIVTEMASDQSSVLFYQKYNNKIIILNNPLK